MNRLLRQFIFDRADAALIDGYGLQPDPELAARNLERAREIIKQMGPRWVCYRPINDQARQAQDDTWAAHSRDER